MAAPRAVGRRECKPAVSDMLGRAFARETTTGGAAMAVRTTAQGILADENRVKREEIVGLLEHAYWMEIETVMSYIANSVNPDGLRAQRSSSRWRRTSRRSSATRSSSRGGST